MIVSLFLNGPYRDAVNYYVPEKLKPKVRLYQRAMVADRGVRAPGIITHIYTGASETEKKALNPVLRLIDSVGVINQEQYQLAERMAKHYLCAKGEALFKMIPAGRRFSITSSSPGKPFEAPPLNQPQEEIVQAVLTEKPTRDPAIHLIHGVTGSGKTRIYLELIRTYLERGLGAIFLLPEIALSYQFLESLKPEFGDQLAILHSGLGRAFRFSEYMRVMRKEARLVVGTRSAIFAPVSDLGVVIIDEEHDSSYKENSHPRYHAKWIALERLSHGQWPFSIHRSLVIGSATPSIESSFLGERGVIRRHTLSERATGFALPKIHIPRYDASEPGADIFSPLLVKKMGDHLARGNQALLLLNRRGYTNFAFCPVCEESAQCPSCSISLTHHRGAKGSAKESQEMRCHLCGYRRPFEGRCHVCHARLKLVGKGIQKVDDAMEFHFPNVAYARLDQDTASQKDYSADVLAAMRERRISVLVGTQMIAKGFDLPGVTLVGLLNADAGLFLPDFRSSERVFQLLVQASGRAGRHGEGEVVMQTIQPHHYAIESAIKGDYEGFYRQELEIRRSIGFPPYSRIFRVVLRGEDEDRLWRIAGRISSHIRDYGNENALFDGPNRQGLPDVIDGPVEAPLYKVKGEYRVHFLARDKKLENLQRLGALVSRYAATKDIAGIHLDWEFDPIDLL